MIWFDIIIFAAVALFLGWRLFTVLGERHGEERERGNPFEAKPSQDAAQDRPASPAEPRDRMHDDDGPPLMDAPPAAKLRPKSAPDSLAGRLEQIADADPRFNEKSFLAGARSAFEMIVGAFAADDTAALRPLLSDDVYDSFAAAIRDRQSRKEKLETRIIRIRETEITEASLTINTARVSVRFVSEQVQTLRDAAGNVIDGGQSHEVTDIWTFTRNTRAIDPNWHLAETRADA